MDSLVFYWVLTLIVLIILTMITDIGTASIVTMFIMVIKFISQSADKRPYVSGFEQPTKVNTKTPKLTPEILKANKDMLDDVLHPEQFSADDKIFDASVVSGLKNKKAKEIRSHWNSSHNQWKKYYDLELGAHESRRWWEDDEEELARKHVVI